MMLALPVGLFALALVGVEGRNSTCQIATTGLLGSGRAFTRSHGGTVDDCCALCNAHRACAAFNWEPTEGPACYLQRDAAPAHRSHPGAVSGISQYSPGPPGPPAPPAVPAATVTVGLLLHRIDPNFRCWTIDASINRGWEARNLADPKLQYLAKESRPGYIRFGGSGNDGLTYGVGRTNFSCEASAFASHCMNASKFESLVELGLVSGGKLVFGLNIQPQVNGSWDPTQARAMMEYGIAKYGPGWVYGFELGNEQNKKSAAQVANPPGFTARAAVECFAVLRDLLRELWPDPGSRPVIIGPDVHGFHNGIGVPTNIRTTYMIEFARIAEELGVPMFALTHHEYIEVAEHRLTPPPGAHLDDVGTIAAAVNATLRAAGVRTPIWVGETGPHNGGSPGVMTDANTRWLNFADSFWYMDAMAQKAVHGYGAFCRQDLVGIDYALLDPVTNDPMPDYFAGNLWGATMGNGVVFAESTASETIRAYSHCTPDNKSLAVMLLNLAGNGSYTTIKLQGVAGCNPTTCDRTEYRLSGPGGTDSRRVALNDVELELAANGILPDLNGARRSGSITIDPATIMFLVFEGAGSVAGC